MKKGFVFSLIAITITTILLSFSLFYFNINENEKYQNLSLQETKKINFVIDNISNTLNSFLGINTTYNSDEINFIFNLNNSPNLSDLNDIEYFYNNTYSELTSGQINLNLDEIESGDAKINFNNNIFDFDYTNTLVKIIPNNTLQYYIKLNVYSSSTSRTPWSFGGSGIYVTLDYQDSAYSYKQSGYISPSIACNTNKFTINFDTEKITIDLCKYNNINGTLIIDDQINQDFDIDANITVYDSEEIMAPKYNANLDYNLGNTIFSGYVPIN